MLGRWPWAVLGCWLLRCVVSDKLDGNQRPLGLRVRRWVLGHHRGHIHIALLLRSLHGMYHHVPNFDLGECLYRMYWELVHCGHVQCWLHFIFCRHSPNVHLVAG